MRHCFSRHCYRAWLSSIATATEPFCIKPRFQAILGKCSTMHMLPTCVASNINNIIKINMNNININSNIQ